MRIQKVVSHELAGLPFVLLLILVSSLHANADAQFVSGSKLVYRVSGELYTVKQEAKVGFAGTEELEWRQVSSPVMQIEQKAKGFVLWPPEAIATNKEIMYFDDKGDVQRLVDFGDQWSTANLLTIGRDRITQRVEGFRVSEVRFRAIHIPLSSWSFISWVSLSWPGLPSLHFIASGSGVGSVVRGWVGDYVLDKLAPVEVEIPLTSEERIMVQAGPYMTVSGRAQKVIVHPSKLPLGSGPLILDMIYRWFWDRETGILVKAEINGASPDGSHIRKLYELTDASGLKSRREEEKKATPPKPEERPEPKPTFIPPQRQEPLGLEQPFLVIGLAASALLVLPLLYRKQVRAQKRMRGRRKQ